MIFDADIYANFLLINVNTNIVVVIKLQYIKAKEAAKWPPPYIETGKILEVHYCNAVFVGFAFVAILFAITAYYTGAFRRAYIILMFCLYHFAYAILIFIAGSKGTNAEYCEGKNTRRKG